MARWQKVFRVTCRRWADEHRLWTDICRLEATGQGYGDGEIGGYREHSRALKLRNLEALTEASRD